jgi:hypothetical protein
LRRESGARADTDQPTRNGESGNATSAFQAPLRSPAEFALRLRRFVVSKNTVTPASFNTPALLDVCDADLDRVKGGTTPAESAVLIGLGAAAVFGGPFGLAFCAGGLLALELSH